jgi:hypothetical protein
MPSLSPNFNWGLTIKDTNDVLYEQLTTVYFDIANIVNSKVGRNVTNVNPVNSSSNNARFDIGDIHINTATNSAFIMTSRTTSNDVIWTLIT